MINNIIYLSWKLKNYIIYKIYILTKTQILSFIIILIIIIRNRLPPLEIKILIYNLNKIINDSKDNITNIL